MVSIEKQGDNFVFEVKGMHKLWSFKSQFTIPCEHVVKAHQDISVVGDWKGWRAPGVSIPSLISAGTFINDGNKIFWDVSNKENCIIVDLKDEEYKQLIVEVENPQEALRTLTV